MVTVVVTFEIPSGSSATEVVEKFRAGTSKWQQREGLIRKYYLSSPDGRTAGGVYLWRSREDADAAFETGFRERIEKTYGSAPSLQYFDTPIVIDNDLGTVQTS